MARAAKRPFDFLSRRFYNAIVFVAAFAPARTERARMARARAFADSLTRRISQSTPLCGAAFFNLVLIFGMSFITFYRPTGEQNGEIEIDTGSFLVSDEGSGQPPGGGGGASVPMLDIVAISAPAPAIVEMSALTTANPTMSFSLPAGEALSGVSPRMAAGSANISNTGSGSPGEAVGSGGGTGGGIGGGNGSGAGVGQGTGDGGEGAGKRIKKIGRIPIDAQKLGVIIDTSPSMKPRSGSARNQAMRYKNAIIKTIGSCDILKTQIHGPAVLDFVEEFGRQGVDAIYWLCDLQDYQSTDGLAILDDLLKKYKMKLYISSWDQPPSPRLQTIVQNSGGAVELNGRLQD